MKKKLFKSLLLSCTLALTVPTLAFAGNWKQDFNGWWYQHENGNYPVNSWMNQNGIISMKPATCRLDGFSIKEPGTT